MKCAIVLKVAAVAVVAGLAGCQDMKPLQADVAETAGIPCVEEEQR